MPLMLKLRRKVSPPAQFREIPPIPDPRGLRAAARFIPGKWYSCKINPPAPGKYDSRTNNMPENTYTELDGNIWDGKDWFYSKYEQSQNTPATDRIQNAWQWRMPS